MQRISQSTKLFQGMSSTRDLSWPPECHCCCLKLCSILICNVFCKFQKNVLATKYRKTLVKTMHTIPNFFYSCLGGKVGLKIQISWSRRSRLWFKYYALHFFQGCQKQKTGREGDFFSKSSFIITIILHHLQTYVGYKNITKSAFCAVLPLRIYLPRLWSLCTWPFCKWK